MEVLLKSDNCSAKVISKGAELKSLTVRGRELMWRADPAFWGKTSPLLFPMIGTLKNGKTLINGAEYRITKHGFARDLELTPETITGTSALFSLEQNDYTKAMYPFDFRFTVQYTLKTDGITVTYRVKNNSASEMPFCIGAHPAFACDGEFTDYRLEFQKTENAAVPETCQLKFSVDLSIAVGVLRTTYGSPNRLASEVFSLAVFIMRTCGINTPGI